MITKIDPNKKPIKKNQMEDMMFLLAGVEQIIILFQQRNQKIDTNPKINKKNQRYLKNLTEKFTPSGVKKWKSNLAIGSYHRHSSDDHNSIMETI